MSIIGLVVEEGYIKLVNVFYQFLEDICTEDGFKVIWPGETNGVGNYHHYWNKLQAYILIDIGMTAYDVRRFFNDLEKEDREKLINIYNGKVRPIDFTNVTPGNPGTPEPTRFTTNNVYSPKNTYCPVCKDNIVIMNPIDEGSPCKRCKNWAKSRGAIF